MRNPKLAHILVKIPVQVGTVENVPSLQVIVAEPSKMYPELQVAV